MDILILIARFIKEEKDMNNSKQSFDESTIIQYDFLVDLISKLKKVIFNYHIDDSKNAFIENILNQTSVVSLLKIKFGTSELPPKSFIDILLQKEQLDDLFWIKFRVAFISISVR